MTTTDTYEQQAQEFLTATGTTMKAEFMKYDKYFNDDKEPRNIWHITLQNARHKYAFKFGQSIEESSRPIPKIYSSEDVEIYYGIRYTEKKIYISHKITVNYKTLLKVKTGEIDPATLINENELVNDYLDFEAKIKKLPKHEQPYKYIGIDEFKQKFIYRIQQEIAAAEKQTFLGEENPEKTAPTAYDILACLTKYDPGSFENFCSEFGYDEDSRRAYKTYKAVVKEFENVEKLFSEEEREQLNKIN